MNRAEQFDGADTFLTYASVCRKAVNCDSKGQRSGVSRGKRQLGRFHRDGAVAAVTADNRRKGAGAAILFGNDGLQHDPPTKPDSIHGDGANGGERGREATLHVTGPASKNAAVMHRGRPRIRCPLP